MWKIPRVPSFRTSILIVQLLINSSSFTFKKFSNTPLKTESGLSAAIKKGLGESNVEVSQEDNFMARFFSFKNAKDISESFHEERKDYGAKR